MVRATVGLICLAIGCTAVRTPDLDADGDVDMADYQVFAAQFRGPPTSAPAGPMTALWIAAPLADVPGWWHCTLWSGGTGLLSTYIWAASAQDLQARLAAISQACRRADVWRIEWD